MGEKPNSKEREALSYIVFLVLCLLITLLALDAYLIFRLF